MRLEYAEGLRGHRHPSIRCALGLVATSSTQLPIPLALVGSIAVAKAYVREVPASAAAPPPGGALRSVNFSNVGIFDGFKCIWNHGRGRDCPTTYLTVEPPPTVFARLRDPYKRIVEHPSIHSCGLLVFRLFTFQQCLQHATPQHYGGRRAPAYPECTWLGGVRT